MYCIFCPANDLPALWAYRGLKQRGLDPLNIVTSEALVYNRRLEHRLQDGDTLTRLTLQDGRVLDGESIRGVLNRISVLPQEHFNTAELADRLYAVQEQQAVFLSLLYGLPGVLINRPGPRGLGGDVRSPAEWAWLASTAGLVTLPLHFESTTINENLPLLSSNNLIVSGIILDGRVFGPLNDYNVSETFRRSIAKLAKLCDLRLLGVDFALGSDGKLCFASATALPDLRLGGEALLDALAEVLS